MSFRAIIAFLLLAQSLAHEPSVPEWVAPPNACLPVAISVREHMRRESVWSEVLVYAYLDSDRRRIYGHAVAVYVYPPDSRQLWACDQQGSTRVSAGADDTVAIARQAEAARGRPGSHIAYAYYLR